MDENSLAYYSYHNKNNVFMSQIIRAKGAKGDVFTVGGWAKTRSVLSGRTSSRHSTVYKSLTMQLAILWITVLGLTLGRRAAPS